MLTITIPGRELWDEEREEFLSCPAATIELEHSLASISKWESKWCRPFLSKKLMSRTQTLDYIRCMTLTPDIDPLVYTCLSDENLQQINSYIDSPMTATTFSDKREKSNKIITSEVIYYWMITLNIPFECQYWHLNRLLTLIHVCDVKNRPAKKLSNREIMSRNAELNAANRKRWKTKG